MPREFRDLLNPTIAISIAGFLTSIVLTGLFSRLGDESAALWSSRAGYLFASILITTLAIGHLRGDEA